MSGSPVGRPHGLALKDQENYKAGVVRSASYLMNPVVQMLRGRVLCDLPFGFDRLINYLPDDLDSRRNFCLAAAATFNKREPLALKHHLYVRAFTVLIAHWETLCVFHTKCLPIPGTPHEARSEPSFTPERAFSVPVKRGSRFRRALRARGSPARIP